MLVHTPARLRGGTVTIAIGTRRVGRIARAGAVVKVDLRGLPRGTLRVTFERRRSPRRPLLPNLRLIRPDQTQPKKLPAYGELGL